MKNISKWIKIHKYHFMGWAIFLFYEVLLVGIWTKHFSNFGTYFTHYLLNISLFYIHAHLTLKTALSDNRRVFWKAPLFILIEISMYVFILFITQYSLIRYTHVLHQRVLIFDYDFIVGAVFRFFYLTSFSSVYYFLKTYLAEKKKTTDMETQRLENIIKLARSENAYLRAQINPHFLFNTLDFIYRNTRIQAPVAAEAIAAVSNMMRYAVDGTSDDELVELGREIDQVEQLIHIHQLKEDEILHIRFWWDEEIRSLKIIPLMLITLAENIFKHGNLKDKQSMATMRIEIKESDLSITTENLVNPFPVISGYGSGLNNISKRLEHAYGTNARLSYSSTEEGYFILNIVIRNIAANL